nr:spectrin beta chain, non-erythrocytic 5-like isoform X2 [Gorilla gorilla gorilla]
MVSLPPVPTTRPGCTWTTLGVREQLQSVQAQWTRLQGRSEQRRRQLLASLQLQEWKQDVAELMQWMEEKGLMAAHEPSGARRNILQTLKRHEAAESELLATRRHVEALQQVGRELLSRRPCGREDIQTRLQGLRSKWEALNRKMTERGDELQQAGQQEQLLRQLQRLFKASPDHGLMPSRNLRLTVIVVGE